MTSEPGITLDEAKDRIDVLETVIRELRIYASQRELFHHAKAVDAHASKSRTDAWGNTGAELAFHRMVLRIDSLTKGLLSSWE